MHPPKKEEREEKKKKERKTHSGIIYTSLNFIPENKYR
jgi:hypothetical protein